KTQVSVAEGNWIFQSYDKPSETIQDQDVHFIGTWIFQEYEKPTKEVLNNNGTNIDNQEVKSGDVLTYKITYKNTTDRDQDIVITDEFPISTEYVNGSTVYDGFSKRKLTWRRSVAKDETVVVTFKVRVKKGIDGEVLENSARIGNNFYSMDTNTTKNPTPFKKYVLPETGGKGRMFYILSGSLITGFAAILMFYRYRIKYASSDL
ncbi:SHIRT domain-containing protein, partial [Streptococcus sp. DD04]|uniref:SHIRT domain-containing protein n=1 Tax=Streptococcus sp. DD04 TaxID=1776578 RepID=UPI0012E983CD